MKKLIIIMTFLISKNAFSIDTLNVKSKITDVTVFFSGAQITRSTELKINAGKHIIKIDNLPQELNPQSIQVAKISNCKILSVKHLLNYKNENKKTSEELVLESKIDAEEFKIKAVKNKLNVFDLEEKLLLDNSILKNKDDGSSINEIKLAADFYRVRINEIRQGKLNLFVDLESLKKKIQEFYLQLNVLTASKRKTFSQIFVTIECTKELSEKLNLTYYTASAGWEPLYDFRVEDINQPLVIVYNANVYQSSGEDWNSVNIKLSNNNPTLSGNKPELMTWYLGRKVSNQNESKTKGQSTLKGRVLDSKTNEALPFANLAVYQGNKIITNVTTDIDGQYTIKPIQSGVYNVKVSYVGYNSTQINNIRLDPNKITFQDFKLNGGVSLQEVEIVEYNAPLIDPDTKSGSTVTREDYQALASKDINSVSATTAGVFQSEYGSTINVRGGRSDAQFSYIDNQKVIGGELSNDITNTLKTTVANLEYVIEIPFTIPSDGEDYSIKIKDVSLPVNYVFNSIPKLDKDAFLTAEISNWTQLNLLSGKSSIYYQGTFTGESFIDANNANDTLNISLGRDKNTIVIREGNKQMIDKRIVGNTVKETIAWDITVRNNKSSKIKMVILDQFPVSEKKSIEVELLESSSANVNPKKGKLTWELQIEPNEKKVLSYKYSVKYPKDINLLTE